MAASNKQPSGPKGGMKAPHTHAPHTAGNPGSKSQAPAPKGPGDMKPHTPKGTGKNANKLH